MSAEELGWETLCAGTGPGGAGKGSRQGIGTGEWMRTDGGVEGVGAMNREQVGDAGSKG